MPRSSEAREQEAARRVHWYERGLVHVLQHRPLALREQQITNGEHRLAAQFAEAMLAFERANGGGGTSPMPSSPPPREPVPEPAPAPRARRPTSRRRKPKRSRAPRATAAPGEAKAE